MRIFWLCLLGLLAYVVSMVVLFPAAPVVDRIKPQLPPEIALQGVSGKLYKGQVASVSYLDDLLPLAVNDVTWKLAPSLLLQGGAGGAVTFKGYGGGGEADVMRRWNGDVVLSDTLIRAEAKELEPLLPVPVAQFNGTLIAELATVRLQNNLLTEINGQLRWQNAVLEVPIEAAFGNIVMDIQQQDAQTHAIDVRAEGGDVAAAGNLTIKLNGDFTADILLTPSSDAAPELVNAIRRVARPGPNGQLRIQQSGNVNRML